MAATRIVPQVVKHSALRSVQQKKTARTIALSVP